MSFTVYSKDGCVFCEKAVELLKKHGKTFEVVKCANGDELRKHLEPYNLVPRTFPQIFEGQRYVGGFTDLEYEMFSEFEIDAYF